MLHARAEYASREHDQSSLSLATASFLQGSPNLLRIEIRVLRLKLDANIEPLEDTYSFPFPSNGKSREKSARAIPSLPLIVIEPSQIFR